MKNKLFYLFLMLILTVSAFALQSGKKHYISGQVLDINDMPVFGAMVFVDNKKTDVITNEKGEFKVKIKADATLLSILNLSGGLINEKIDGRTVINFKLNNVAPPQEPVVNENPENEVVNIGYGTAQKKDLASSVVNLDGQNKRYASYQNVFDMIKGEIPGVQVSGNQITIRGIGTINGSSDPLVLVNGVEISMDGLGAIVPRNIQTINILNSSDASIYGSKAANGVILITLIGK